jgi:hypothetical protein
MLDNLRSNYNQNSFYQLNIRIFVPVERSLTNPELQAVHSGPEEVDIQFVH